MFALFQGGCLAALFLTHLRGQENTINQMMILISAGSFAVSVAFMIWVYFQLDVRRTAHERSESRIREIFESNPNALILCDSRGRIQMVNRETEELFGFSREALVGEPIEILVPQDRRDHHKRHVEKFFEDPEKRNMGEGWDLGGRHASGEEFPVSVGLTPIMMPEGLCTLAAVIDISDRVEAEEEIKRSNRELEQFAYVASHDLKSPLRGVAQLVEWITEKLQGDEDEELKRYLELLGSRVDRMQVMLNSLLEYSRAGRREDRLEEVDANQLVQSISESLAPMNGWTVRIDRSLPVLITQQSALSQVFHNLIGNAIKHHDRDTGEIAVSALDNGAFCEFSVYDDGPGIRPEFHERIFGMFQTLRPRDEVEGSGMGLSLVKKLVEQQGGVIRIESDPAQARGTCFRFTWPREVECRRSA
ncbi:sensor histidine kinase [Aestuariispira insulae]|uniref:histidine kinase n=1 Tax=Aestuariispira insulae TaxID=1461337 RepID=A0A3D9HGR3_9PROT|nr:ATP-binding protein [Aestuariispira insulae]RED48595.1 PAS domain S-box-containing protein [Aestuariispira insulae]